jgi:hypothetical protein
MSAVAPKPGGLESGEQICYNNSSCQGAIYESAGDKRLSRAYLL